MPQTLASLVLVLLLFPGNASRAEVKAHSISTSRQFIIYGASIRVRGAIGDLAETTKKNLLGLLASSDAWKTPIVLNLEVPQANLPELAPLHLDFSQTGAGLKIQLDLLVNDNLSGRQVQREILRAILLEIIYRHRPGIAAGSRYVTPPDWLIDGLLPLMPGHDTDEDAQLLATLLAKERLMPLDELVRQRIDQLDLPSQKIHDAYSMALVQLLLDSPDGRRKLMEYIIDLPDAPNDAYADLRVHFPLTLGRSAEKSWSLSVAHLSAADRYEILSAAETEMRLDRILHFPITDDHGHSQQYSLGDFPNFLTLPGAPAALRRVAQQLLLLAARANPSYHDTVQEDYQIALLLARGQTHGIKERLARVASYRDVVEEGNAAIDDYMNWYEATQLKTMSGAFSALLQNASETDAPPRRRDPISVYLDSIEAQLK